MSKQLMITVSEDFVKLIEDYKYNFRYDSKSAVVRDLVIFALEQKGISIDNLNLETLGRGRPTEAKIAWSPKVV